MQEMGVSTGVSEQGLAGAGVRGVDGSKWARYLFQKIQHLKEGKRLSDSGAQLRNGAEKLKEESVPVREILGKYAEGE